MKKQTQNMKLFLLLTFFVMLMQSCTKDPDSTGGNVKTTYHYLTAAQLNQTPYFTNPAFDTISFASDKGDTLSFVKTKTDTTWYCEKRSSTSDTKICYQTIHNTYSTTKGIGSFEVKHGKKENAYNNFIEITFNNFSFLFGDYQVGYSGYWNYKKTIELNSKIYNDVMILYPNDYDSLIAECYLNKENGVFYCNDKINNIQFVKYK